MSFFLGFSQVIAFSMAFFSIIYLLNEFGLQKNYKIKFLLIYKRFDSLFHDKRAITKPLFYTIFLALMILVIVFFINLYFFNVIENENEFSKFGQFGDFMGGILNPIFMFLTLFALIITIILQRKELKLARKEYSKTSTALNTQAIENTFFNTINLHYRIVENLKINFSDFGNDFLTAIQLARISSGVIANPFNGEYTGIRVFDETLNKVFKSANNANQTLVRYKILQNKYNYIFGHYFRNLYQALKLIDKNEYLDEENKKKYTSILRAQLSSSELALLFLNCLDGICDKGQFKNLLIKYKMFEHIIIERKTYEEFIISRIIKVNEKMVKQYLNIKDIEDLNKSVQGAFGNNKGISIEN